MHNPHQNLDISASEPFHPFPSVFLFSDRGKLQPKDPSSTSQLCSWFQRDVWFIMSLGMCCLHSSGYSSHCRSTFYNPQPPPIISSGGWGLWENRLPVLELFSSYTPTTPILLNNPSIWFSCLTVPASNGRFSLLNILFTARTDANRQDGRFAYSQCSPSYRRCCTTVYFQHSHSFPELTSFSDLPEAFLPASEKLVL